MSIDANGWVSMLLDEHRCGWISIDVNGWVSM